MTLAHLRKLGPHVFENRSHTHSVEHMNRQEQNSTARGRIRRGHVYRNTSPECDKVEWNKSYSRWEEGKYLGRNFVPGAYDVLCARGNKAWNHSGNVSFRALVKRFTFQYAVAADKKERSFIVSEIMDEIRSKGNRFVKQKGEREWIEVSDTLSREKVGQLLRNSLSSQYKSSFKSKKIHRQKTSPEIEARLQELVLTNKDIQSISQRLMREVSKQKLANKQLAPLFDEANVLMLSIIKKDQALSKKFEEAVYPVNERAT